jgi:hypothetical protein
MKKIWDWVYERIWPILAALGTLFLLWIIFWVHYLA